MKKQIAWMLALALTLALTACGGKKPASYPVQIESPTRTSAPASSEVPAPSQEPEESWLVKPTKAYEIEKSLAAEAEPQVVPGDWYQNMALFTKDGKTGLIDMEGRIIVSEEENVHWCPLCGVTNDQETKIFDQNGELVGSGGHDMGGGSLLYDDKNDILYSSDYGMLTPWTELPGMGPEAVIGDVVTITKNPDATNFMIDSTGEGVDVSEAKGHMLFKPDGSQLDGVIYEQLRYAGEGLYAGRVNGAWGYVDAVTGNQIIPFIYRDVLPFHQGLAAVNTDDGWTYIDLAGKQKTRAVFEEAATAHDGRAWVKTEKGWGVIRLEDWA